MDRTRMLVGAMVVLAASMSSPHASAQSIGFLHIPSTVPQYLGWGYGAGHQAPIVRTPAQRPVRMQRAMIHPAYCGPLWPAAYEPVGCYGGPCPTCELGAAGPLPQGGQLAPPPAISPPVALRPTPYGWQ